MTTTAIKILALIFMTIDHIGEFIPGMPIAFRWLGRISAPLFFFCAAEGICHTHDKKAYLKRLYKFSLLMVMLDVILPVIIGGTALFNNIFTTIFQGTLLIYLIEETKNDSRQRVKYLFGYIGWQVITLLLYFVWESFVPVINLPVLNNADRIIFTALGSVTMMEGSLLLTAQILIFYFCRNSKKHLAIGYTVYCAAYFAVFVFQLPLKALVLIANAGAPQFLIEMLRNACGIIGLQTFFSARDFVHSLLYVNYQWFMFFALPFMLAYNGKKGKGLKNLFYAYYPLHIALLYAVGSFM